MFLKTFQTKFLLNTLKGLSKICFLKHSLKCTTFSYWLLRFLTTKKILLLWCTCAKWSKVIKNPNILLTFLTQHHDHPDLLFTTSEHAKVIISHQTSFASLLKTCYGPLGITFTCKIDQLQHLAQFYTFSDSGDTNSKHRKCNIFILTEYLF